MSIINEVYNKYCRQRFSLPTEAQVQDLEDRLGITLPSHYREFLLNYNGGFFDDPTFGGEEPDYEPCPLDALNTLMGIQSQHDFATLGEESDILIFDDNDPVVILPIGDTPGGNLVLLSVDITADEYGTVFLKRIDSSVLMPGKWFELADSMEEFFDLLREPLE